jgi:hypothetical protein
VHEGDWLTIVTGGGSETIISKTNPDGGAGVARTRIGRSVELVAQIEKRLVVGGLWTQAFVCRVRS